MTVFADAHYFIALLNADDEHHAKAREFTRAIHRYGERLDKAWSVVDCISFLAVYRKPSRPTGTLSRPDFGRC